MHLNSHRTQNINNLWAKVYENGTTRKTSHKIHYFADFMFQIIKFNFNFNIHGFLLMLQESTSGKCRKYGKGDNIENVENV